MVEVVGETYIRLVTKFKSAGESRCILVLPGTSGVTADTVLEGTNAVGEPPPAVYVNTNQSFAIDYNGLLPGFTYVAYCAQKNTLALPFK